MKKAALTLAMIFMIGCLASAQSIPPDSLYLGQTPPGNTPQIFAPGIISLPGRKEYGISISPEGNEMLFAIGNWPGKRTMIMKYENNHWTSPDTVSFSITRSAEEAIYSPEGQRVYYYAFNPPNPLGGSDLCYSEKTGSIWGEPINLGGPLNTTQDEYHPCVVADSSIYFENSAGKICYSKFQNGNYLQRILMPSIFNDPDMAWGNPFVSPDESYFLFNSSRPGGYGGTDLYISYKKSDGNWTNPKNLGNIINTATSECGSEITDDNLYMTYVSNRDIYWVGSGFIDSLRYTNFLPYVRYKIPDQTTIVWEPFNFIIPDSSFIDDDGNNTLKYHAVLSNGNPLPEWLDFDTITATFSGTPDLVQTINIMVTAIDTAGASVSTDFNLKVEEPNAIPQPKEQNIKIFPNPTTGMIRVSCVKFTNQPLFAEIRNVEGSIILKKSFEKETNIDLTGRPGGLYFLKLFNGHETIVRKIIL